MKRQGDTWRAAGVVALTLASAPQVTSAASDIQLTIRTTKRQYTNGERIIVVATLKNAGTTTEDLPELRTGNLEDLQITVRCQDPRVQDSGAVTTVEDASGSPETIEKTTRLAPGQTVTTTREINGMKVGFIGRVRQHDGIIVQPVGGEMEILASLVNGPSRTVLATARAPIYVFLGDLNRDGRVDEADLQILRSVSGAACGDAKYDPVIDLNGDCRIDTEDERLLKASISRFSLRAGAATGASAIKPGTHRPPKHGTSSGALIWSGTPGKDGLIRIEGQQATSGTLRGDFLPGVPVKITVSPSDIVATKAPAQTNGYKLLELRSPRRTNMIVSIRWDVLSPQ